MATYKDKIPTAIRVRAERKLDWCVKQFHKVFDAKAQGLKYPEMDYLKKGVAGAHADCGTNTISMNKVYLLEQTENMIEDTIPHEFAHLVTHFLYPRASAHGREWKMVCRKLFGKELSRTHSYCPKNARVRNVTIRRWIYTCGCVGKAHSLTKQKHNHCQTQLEYHDHTLFRCVSCKQYIEWSGTVTEHKR